MMYGILLNFWPHPPIIEMLRMRERTHAFAGGGVVFFCVGMFALELALTAFSVFFTPAAHNAENMRCNATYS